jgi:prolyl 4-hydroxylase
MIVNCPASCRACHLLDPKTRCDRNFLNISVDPIFQPGEMDVMFRSIPSLFGHLYEVEVLSESPWVVVLHNFVNDDEIEAILQSVAGNWERSTDTGSMNEFGETGRVVSRSRTSSNAWCRSECENHPMVRHVLNKIEDVTRVPSDHYESFQILKYDEGQYYRVHHDMAV